MRHAVLPLFERSRGWRSQPGAAVKGEVKPAAYPSPYRPGRADGLTWAASVGEAAVRQPADEPPTTASGRNLVGGEMNRDRAEAAVTPQRQSRFREKPRKEPAGKRRHAQQPVRVGPTTRIRPAAGLRAHRRQPKGRAGAIWRRRSQGNRNRAFGPAYAAAATPLRTARSGRDGDGTGAFGAGQPATRVGPIQREAPTCRRTDKQGSGRREAERERRPADGVGYQRGWARQLTIPERSGDARTAPFPAGPCPAQGAGRAVDRPDFHGWGQFGAKRHSCRNAQHAAFRPERSAEAGGWLLMFSDTHAQGSCTRRQRCPGHRHARRFRYSPGSDRYTPDPSPPGR